MPSIPDVDASYAAFLQNMQAFAPERRTPSRWKRPGRVLLAAILAVLAVFGSLFTAQALGADVFGKLAQWTVESRSTVCWGPNAIPKIFYGI